MPHKRQKKTKNTTYIGIDWGHYWMDPAIIVGYKKGKVIYIEHP